MRVSDLIRAGGSLDDAAYGGMAELARYAVVNGEMRQTQLLDVDLAKVRAADESADIRLQPFDHLVIKEVTDWRRNETVEILGEVRFPGVYPIRRGEALQSVIERAGGMTDLAFIEGSVFTRESLKSREREQVAILTRRMETDLATLSLTAAQETGRDPSGALAVGRSMLVSLREAEPVGRLVIDLQKVVGTASGSRADILLKDGDKLIVPRITQEVTVLGEVQSATSHLYEPGLNRNDYIELSGGMAQRADKKRTYVVRANGSVIANGNSWWGNTTMRPGDTIVVPLNTQYTRLLPAMTQVTQIVYNLAVAAAAVASF
jgi:protein involved in polysaccharide export with SLBB domain